MNIYIGEPKIITLFDTQGPCPDGFHVPLISELEGLKTIMTGLSLTTGNQWKINLHLPLSGMRDNLGTISVQGSIAYYLSSSANSIYGSCLALDSTNVIINSSIGRSNGASIRPFKNEFAIPASGWTVINGTLGSAGIFWNQTDGIISITSNGTTGYTIADKNLGATTVYNNGNTLSESNCGKYYQRGNNYGFAFSGNITTTNTLVDASTYGPGNYYESSTFIRVGNYPYDWSNVKNDNLRGGVTQGSSTKQVPQEVKNIYIGEYGWKPGANTLLYCPLDTANGTNDITGNYTLSSATITTLSGIECLHIGKNYSQIYTTTNFPYSSSSIFTVNVWGRCDDTSKYVQFAGRWCDSPVIYNWMLANMQAICGGSTNYITQVTPIAGWHNYCAVFNGNQYPIMYRDGVEVSRSGTSFGTSHVNTAPLYIGDTTWSNTDGYVNRVIIESVARTVQEIADYYNLTKGKYGIS